MKRLNTRRMYKALRRPIPARESFTDQEMEYAAVNPAQEWLERTVRGYDPRTLTVNTWYRPDRMETVVEVVRKR